MNDAAMNSGLTLHKITNANACLASTTTKQYNAITKLLSDIKLRSASPGTGNAAREQTATNQKTRTTNTLQVAVKKPLGHQRILLNPRLGRWAPPHQQFLKNKGPETSAPPPATSQQVPAPPKNKGWKDFA